MTGNNVFCSMDSCLNRKRYTFIVILILYYSTFVVKMVYFCCVLGCRKEWYRGCGLSFHRIPKDESMAEKWKKIIPGKVTKTSVVCNLHFKNEDFINQAKKSLKPNAIPSIFPVILPAAKTVHVLSSIALVAPPQQPSCSSSELPEKKQKFQEEFEKSTQTQNISADTPRKKKLRREVKILSQRLKRRNITINNLKSLLAILKKRCDNYSEVEEMIQLNFQNIHEKINTKKSKHGVRYSDDLKSFALTLFYYSGKAYLFLRNHISLPHPATLRRILSTHNCNVGFMSEVFNFLKETANNRSETLANVALIFDSMSIKSAKRYDEKNDKMWGGIDLGGIVPTEAEKLASEVLVFQIVALKEKFKCPIAYFFVDKISANVQAQLLLTAIRMLADINIIVRCLTSDGASANFKTYEILGCDFNIPDIKPFFKHPIRDTRVHCILDPVHMIKLARNVFAEMNLSSEKGEIKFEYLKKLQKMQEEEGLKLANKISRAHINFFGKKMNVRLAVQVLSSSAADALDFLRSTGNKNFIGSEATVEYLRYLDRIFDILDSKNPFGTGFKSPLRPQNKDIWLNIFQETREYLSKLKVNGQNILTHRRKTPALGLIIDTFSFTNLATDLFEDNTLKYFLTHKTSQDHLELFFSCVRASGRTNDNPDALQFMYTMRKLLFRNSVKPSINANCTDEDYNCSPMLEFRSAKRLPFQDSRFEKNEKDNIDSLMQMIEKTNVSDFKNNILYYISGYIVGKMLKNMTCEYCRAALITRDHKEHDYIIDICKFSSFTAFIDRGGLKYASKFVFDIVNYTEKLFLTLSLQMVENLKRKYMINIITEHFYTRLKDIYHPVQSYTTETRHEVEIIKCIVNKFLNMRLKTYAKEETLKIMGNRISMRQRLHNTVLFNNV